ncbi:MAG: CIA30 family protein [Candidatus Sulfobium sp.]|jgi:NADH dehydrogenase [ubiquinone] 1 alpha subcomplex assembly factor 1
MMDKTVIDFNDAGEKERWEAINDVVMGGLSEGHMSVIDGAGVFQGGVSLENFGGFASVRSLPRELGLEGYDGLIVRVRGDGRRYRLRLKTDDEFEGIAYQATFFTRPAMPGEWTDAGLSFDEFVPVFRGHVVGDAPGLDPARVRRVGFMIADRQEGPFRLEIREVRAYREERDR